MATPFVGKSSRRICRLTKANDMTDETTLSLTRHINASPQAVWRCWTEVDLIKQWFAPKPVETIHADIEPWHGGKFNTTMRVPDHGDHIGEGCVLIADLGKRLVTTNMMTAGFVPVAIGDGDIDFPYVIDLTMDHENYGCRYTAQVRHADAAGAAKHAAMGFEQGWGAATDQLATLARTL